MGRAQQDELIQEVLERHGVMLGRDDPILVLHTINQRLATEFRESLDTRFKELGGEMEQLYLRWDVESREKAERILAAAVANARNHLLEAAADLTVDAKRNLDEATRESVDRLIAAARRLEWMALGIAVVGVIAATAFFMRM